MPESIPARLHDKLDLLSSAARGARITPERVTRPRAAVIDLASLDADGDRDEHSGRFDRWVWSVHD
jgi:hypothetical protein